MLINRIWYSILSKRTLVRPFLYMYGCLRLHIVYNVCCQASELVYIYIFVYEKKPDRVGTFELDIRLSGRALYRGTVCSERALVRPRWPICFAALFDDFLPVLLLQVILYAYMLLLLPWLTCLSLSWRQVCHAASVVVTNTSIVWLYACVQNYLVNLLLTCSEALMNTYIYTCTHILIVCSAELWNLRLSSMSRTKVFWQQVYGVC